VLLKGTTNILVMKTTSLLLHSFTSIPATLALALGLCTYRLNAADEKAADTKAKAGGAPDMAAMMKQMEELAAPGPEHQKLASMTGEWDTEVRSYMGGPDEAPMVSKGICKGRMILGGRFLQEEFEGDMMGKKFHGMGLLGYDKFNKKFVDTWIDDMGTGIFISEGTADASGDVITLTGKMDDPMTGQKNKEMRLVTRILSPDKHTFEMHDVALGDKGKMMEITYVRKGAAPAKVEK
jgi:hypothetical protein